MSSTSFPAHRGNRTLWAALALTTAIGLISHAAPLPPVEFAYPANQATGIPSDPVLTWTRGPLHLISNGGFESGEFAPAWQSQTISGFGGFEVDDGTTNPNGPDEPTPPLQGGFCALLASFAFGGNNGLFELSQLVAIPSTVTNVRLEWSHLIRNYANNYSQDQYFRVELRSPTGTILETLYSTQPGDPNNTGDLSALVWVKESANLDAYAGQTVRVVFRAAVNDENLNLRLDRVQMTALAGPAISNEVYVSLNPTPGAGDLRATTSDSFLRLDNLNPNSTYYWRVDARSGTDFQAGQVRRFSTGPLGAPSTFQWDTPAEVNLSQGFPVTLTAQDSLANATTSVSGQASLSAVLLQTGQSRFLLNNSAYSSFNELEETTVGYTFTPNTDIFVQAVRVYGSGKVSLWTESGRLLASQLVEGPPNTATVTPLASPVALQADRTYRLGFYVAERSQVYLRFDAPAIFAHGALQQSYISRGDRPPQDPHPAQWWFVDLNYVLGDAASLSVNPSTSGSLAGGAWSGNISLTGPSSASGQVILLAEIGGAISGYSAAINLLGPNPDALRFTSIEVLSGQIQLQFQAKAGETYSVLYSDTLPGGTWSKLTDIQAGASDQPQTVTDPDGINGSRFYMVVTPAQ